MQPYLFPYIGYWQLINAIDQFVVYDNIQFSKRGWFHRNNILLNGQKILFTVPLKKDSDVLNVSERFLADNAEKTVEKICAQIRDAYRKAPFFEEVYPQVEAILKYKEKNLFLYIFNSIKELCRLLGIDTPIIVSSTIDINHGLKSQEKVLAIAKAMNATGYLNPIGGTELYECSPFEANGVELMFLKSKLPEYRQYGELFIPYLSIIDVMMFNSKGQIRKMLDEYTILHCRVQNV